MNWNLAIIENSKIKKLLCEINNQLKYGEEENKKISLMSGQSGVLLFLYYYKKYIENSSIMNPYEREIEDIFDSLNKGFNFPTFAGGLAGIAWTFQHLAENDFLDNDFLAPLLGLEQFMQFNHEYEFVKKEHYDYLHGGLGYHLAMMNSHLQKKSITNTLQFLDRTTLRIEDGIVWTSIPKLNDNEKVINLSLSHGLASIIQILGKTYKYSTGDEAKKCKELLNGAIQYLLSKKQNPNEMGSYFPSWITKSHTSSYSRLAWCYGDLGIAMALLQVGIDTENEEWKEIAIEILLHTAKRRSLQKNHVKDAGLCHGTAGIAHCFNRAYNFTGNGLFKDTAVYWFMETLKMAKYKDGLAGFKVWRTNKDGGLYNDPGLLEGIAGIGLSLISAVAPIDPKWDECLLLS